MFNKKVSTETSPEQLARELEQVIEQRDFLLSTARALIYFLKEFSFDLKEIDAESFRKRVDKLADTFIPDESAKTCQRAFEGNKSYILDFIGKEKRYFSEKESEFKNIIELLSNGLTEMIGESKTFSAQVYEGNIRIEKITCLDDIKKIREGLKSEINQMKEVVRVKQTKDALRLNSLSKEVDFLRINLEKVKDASLTDPVTGANNRLAFDTYIRKLVDRNYVSWKPFSILMCDIDNFKNINDAYGHRTGDRVLKILVQECKARIREDDFIARYGGEEFAIILPGVSLRQAVKRAQNICQNLMNREYAIDTQNSRAVIKFTVSIGVGEVRKGDTVESLIERTDAALYQAKRSGKNQAASERDIKIAA